MNNLKVLICTLFGMVGTLISDAFGGWTADMTTLIICMSIDFVMGVSIAFIFKKSPKTETGAADSRSCFKGLCKKCIMLMFVLLAYRLDVSLGTSYIKTVAIIGFITNELLSIVENAGIMGIALPKPVAEAIELLKEKNNA